MLENVGLPFVGQSDMIHPNIMSLRGLCMDPFCIVLEYCCIGSLYHYIHDKKRVVNWAVVLKLAMDIAQGMRFMHNFQPPLIHRDLKSPNVLLATEPTDAGYSSVIAKVADFGFSRSLMLSTQLNSVGANNPVWLAPEVIQRKAYDGKADVYSYGVIIWELVSREDFLKDIFSPLAIEQAVLQGERPQIPEECLSNCPEFASLIAQCWTPKPSARPTFSKICKELAAIIEKRLPIIGDKLPPIIETQADEASSANIQTEEPIQLMRHRQPTTLPPVALSWRSAQPRRNSLPRSAFLQRQSSTSSEVEFKKLASFVSA